MGKVGWMDRRDCMTTQGARIACLAGPAGTLIAFDTNIIHRGSRPAGLKYRDGILIEVVNLAALEAPRVAPDSTKHPGFDPPAAAAEQGGGPPRRQASVAKGEEVPHAPPPPKVNVAVDSLHLTLNHEGREPKTLPLVGFGTANRPSAKGAALRRSLADFFALGGRLVDTAQMYGNAREIGDAVAAAGLSADDVFVVSKLNTNRRMKGFVTTADGAQRVVEQTLQQLRLPYLHAMLLHLPWGLTPEEQISLWRGLIASRKQGKLRHIGVSNYNVQQIELLVRATGVVPAINEIEFHPWVPSQVMLSRAAPSNRADILILHEPSTISRTELPLPPSTCLTARTIHASSLLRPGPSIRD